MDPKQDDQSAVPESPQPQIITPTQNIKPAPTTETPPTPIEEPTAPVAAAPPQPPVPEEPTTPQDTEQQPDTTEVAEPQTPPSVPVQAPTQPESPVDDSPQQPSAQPTSDTPPPQVAGIPTMQPKKPTKNRKKLILIIAIPFLIVLTAVGIFLGLKVFSDNITLVEYSGEKFSISYPEGYEEKTQSGLIYFEEPIENTDATGSELEELEKTQSGVIVGIQEIPASLKDEQKALIRTQYEKAGDEFAEGIAGNGQEVKNQESTENIDLAGMPAKRITAELYEGDKKVANIRVVFALNEKRLVVVAVLAHEGDSSLAEKAQKIIDSFKLVK